MRGEVAHEDFYGADLAYIHHLGFSAFARAAAPAFATLLERAGIRRGRIVDLGCGSGVLARELTAFGHTVVGIDASREMLAIAREQAPAAEFVQGDLHAAPLGDCDAVFAIGESLSYCGARPQAIPLAAILSRIGRAVRPGGLLVFDLVVRGRPLMAYRTWQAGEGWAVLVDVREDRVARTVTRDITTFRAATHGYRRGAEKHTAAVYSRLEVVRWLHTAGFSSIVRRRYGRVALPPRRLGFVARRRGLRRATAP